MLLTSTLSYLDAETVETNFDITPDCIFLQNGRLTETGLIENAAQTSAIIVQRHKKN